MKMKHNAVRSDFAVKESDCVTLRIQHLLTGNELDDTVLEFLVKDIWPTFFFFN